MKEVGVEARRIEIIEGSEIAKEVPREHSVAVATRPKKMADQERRLT
jgi:hypothetical protein